MSLTKQDLAVIKQLIDSSVGSAITGLEDRLFKRIDELDDTLSLQVEHGLQEVRDQVDDVKRQVDDVKQIVERTERVLLNEVDRNNEQDKTILKIRKSLHAA